jgi:hypothetical protein
MRFYLVSIGKKANFAGKLKQDNLQIEKTEPKTRYDTGKTNH